MAAAEAARLAEIERAKQEEERKVKQAQLEAKKKVVSGGWPKG